MGASCQASVAVAEVTVISHVSPKIIATVGVRFGKTFKNGGMIAVVDDIKACYSAVKFTQTEANELAAVTCLLYDYTAYLFNKSFTTHMVAQGYPNAADPPDPGTMSAYLAPSAFTARLDIYANIPFGAHTQDFATYFEGAPDKVLEIGLKQPVIKQ
jgi:hypothetical protein